MPSSNGTIDSMNASKHRYPRKIFVCGDEWWFGAVQLLFPQYEGPIIEIQDSKEGGYKSLAHLIQSQDVTSEDLLFGHLHKAQLCIQQNVMRFPGKQLWYNLEPVDEMRFTARSSAEPFSISKARERQYRYLPPGDDIHVVGPNPNEGNNKNVHVYPGVMLFYASRFMRQPLEQLTKLVDLAQKPTNTQQNFIIYIQSHRVGARERAVSLLSKSLYDATGEPMHIGGKCQGNPTPHPESATNALLELYCIPHDNLAEYPQLHILDEEDVGRRNKFHRNDIVFSQYQFSVCFENSDRDGYISEKILHAFFGGSIPVYWGSNKDVMKLFNPDSFIYYDMEKPQGAIAKILYLKSNQTAYNEMLLTQPILREGEKTLQEYFSLSKDVEGGHLRKKIMQMMGYSDDIDAKLDLKK